MTLPSWIIGFLPWLSQNAVGILGTIVAAFIAYHVHFLSKRVGLRGRLEHKAYISEKVEQIFVRIARGERRRVELINIARYPNDYQGKNERNRHGYMYLGAELKSLRFDGIEFFCNMRTLYRSSSGQMSLEEKDGFVLSEDTVAEVGVIPYDWIEFVDTRGDEFSYRPQFFVKFAGKEKLPYRYLRYYAKSKTYTPGTDPLDMEWVSFEL